MAHSSTTEVDYLIHDERGKLIKVVRHQDIKHESLISTGVYNHHPSESVMTSSRIYNQAADTSNGTNYIKLTNYVKQENNSNYSVVQHTTQNLGTPIKYNNFNTVIKEENAKCKTFVNNNNQSTSKSKPAVQSQIRRRKPDKIGRGLRHFSMKVCEKVREKGITTYNEVADELVNEEIKTTVDSGANCDQKNIRRRVYDALNVLMAMNIISKDKKEIKWIGLPSTKMQQCSLLEKENQKRRERIEAKHQQLRELLLQQISFKSLVDRNRECEKQGIIPAPNSSIQLPFIIVNTHKSTKINCSVSNDKSEYYFKFNDKFEIHDDVEVLRRMGLLLGLDKGECTNDDIEKAKSMVPKNFEKYIEAYSKGQNEIQDPIESFPFVEMSDNLQNSGLNYILEENSNTGLEVDILCEDDIIAESSDIE